jgi:hypothetical protein
MLFNFEKIDLVEFGENAKGLSINYIKEEFGRYIQKQLKH